MLVDDDLPSRRLTDIFLQDANVTCTVSEAKDGKEAIEMLRNSDELPDVILLDINMPVMDGFGFLAEYKNLPKAGSNTKIYMLTTSVLEKDYLRALATGLVKDYFEKPISVKHIEQILGYCYPCSSVYIQCAFSHTLITTSEYTKNPVDRNRNQTCYRVYKGTKPK